ncbi:hypothetical protein PtrSN002B_002400 [Pyrenophora tritici-repentis]|uniref:Uncharacterized protein n=1 Tax=Pyrenophora tritici-repentis TaxID=45151 RepID=A0A2W1GZ99_9PLEO|nr:hypothetical protein PtrV1_00887 [Pyrenophora tritici-repentis]KAF7453609.1 hypothetical protein A1F99_008670 [Pyrenophora tritici-repentis]KAF7576692.1 hypothetical protein PtrM4_009320 [Pyrenophora tritici-repentis]KAI1544480.1 hypothetical protein PtrSN001A_002676 [Pyrenophora tritici-repentis]KAI1547012.1 hypothetical protein PtrSN001C_002605 [Pyrenophora tritici-repentis]
MLGVWQLLATAVSSTPLPFDEPALSAQSPVVYGEPVGPRTSFVVTSKFCICLLSGLLGHRVRLVDRNTLHRITLTQVYVLVLYILSIGFVFASAIVHNGLGLNDNGSCQASMRICIAFYASSKVAMYLFLVERVHTMRASHLSRKHDVFWLLSTIAIVISLGAICLTGFISPVYWLSSVDGRCRIGLQRYAVIPLLTCDIVINLYLTLVFIYLLSPLVKDSEAFGAGFASRVAQGIGILSRTAKQKATFDLQRSNQVMARKFEKLLWKTLIGCVLVIVPTAGNLAALTILVGKELAFVCLTICTLDVTWAAVVFHWLTLAGSDEKESVSTT